MSSKDYKETAMDTIWMWICEPSRTKCVFQILPDVDAKRKVSHWGPLTLIDMQPQKLRIHLVLDE